MTTDITNNSKDSEDDVGYVPEFQKDWNMLVRSFREKNIELIEFDARALGINNWHLFIAENLGNKKSKKSLPTFNRALNNYVIKGLQGPRGMKQDYWSKLSHKGIISGLYIPLNDIRNIKIETLKSHLNYYQLKMGLFPYESYFYSLKRCLSSADLKKLEASYAIWIYIYYYGQFLNKLKQSSIELYAMCADWFTELIDDKNFYQRLPSEQVTILMLQSCESIIANDNNEWTENPLLEKATEDVRLIFNSYRDTIVQMFQIAESPLEQLDQSSAQMVEDMKKIFLLDGRLFLIQDILDNRSSADIYRALPVKLIFKYGPMSLRNISDVIVDVFQGRSRIAGDFKENSYRVPHTRPDQERVYEKDVQYWYDIIPEDQDRILELVRSRAPESDLERSLEKSKVRCQGQWLNLLNLITSPILTWIIDEENNLLPLWNLFGDQTAKEIRDLHKQRKKTIEKEKIDLEKHLKAIAKIKTKEALLKYQELHNPIFSENNFQKKWDYELLRKENLLDQREKYLHSRMEEFGLSIDGDAFFTQAWLDELLNIEEEIKPYINFVKQAFQTALPVRRTVIFSKDRHVIDGVEFDPDTIFDQEKWIRADVMKSMQTKVDLGEAVQVNTFCLDYSGSMRHDRMRNLFKILYLLVLGLEDRKTFDAFHFFSNRFIEVADFTNEYTNRKVLLKILKQIAVINNNDIKYGGSGGTNISDGVGKSYSKMQSFLKGYTKANPRTNIVSSIFVITDGEPSMGIIDIPELNDYLNQLRKEGDVEIKGIFIDSENEIQIEIMEEIFGADNYVETTDFKEGVNKFVRIMTQTYKKQRRDYKWKKKKQKIGLDK